MQDFLTYLRQSAPWARTIAPTLCRKDTAPGEDCAAVHGSWQLLRLLGLVGSNDLHAAFFDGALRRLPAAPPPRVLICGSADYFMLDLVLRVFRDRGIEPRITVVDRCDTPLALNRWYADRVSCRIEAIKADLLEFHDAEGFDAICAHAFLGYFAPAVRPRLFAAWQQALRPGGCVITVNTLRDAQGPERLVFDAEQVNAFHDAASRAAEKFRNRSDEVVDQGLDMNPAEIAELAAAYARAHASWPVRSAVLLRAQFEDAGWALEVFSRYPGSPERPPGLSGPSVQHQGGFVRIIARRI